MKGNQKAKTPEEYMKSLPPERAEAIGALRKVILRNLPAGFEEVMQYGMIGYVVPLSLYPKGYLGKKDVPLPYIGLASQKNHMAVYLMNIYVDKKTEKWFFDTYKKSGKPLDMGKSCLRFKKLEDVALPVIGEVVGKFSVKNWIKIYENSRK